MTKTYGELQRTNCRDPKSYFSVCFSKGSMTFLLIKYSYREKNKYLTVSSVCFYGIKCIWKINLLKVTLFYTCFVFWALTKQLMSKKSRHDEWPIFKRNFLQSKKRSLINLLKFWNLPNFFVNFWPLQFPADNPDRKRSGN